MRDVFLVVNIKAEDLAGTTIESRDELVDPLHEALEESELGEVSGSGAGMGYIIDVFGNGLRMAFRTRIHRLSDPISENV